MKPQFEVPIILQPFINSILADTEKQLQELLRVPVKLNMVINEADVIMNHLCINEMVCDQFALPYTALASKLRTVNISTARHIYCYLCRRYLKMSFNTIGKTINKDHASVMYAVSAISDYIVHKDAYVHSNITPLIEKIQMLLNEKIQVEA
jgi:chromosomal replication initiation ATPase DnaA